MPIDELAAVAAEFDVPMHTDAVQAVGQLPVDFGASGLCRDERGRTQVRRTGRYGCAAASSRRPRVSR